MDVQQQIRAFLADGPFAVVGASVDRRKYGNKVLRAYVQRGLRVFPVHPTEAEIEGLAAYPDVASLPEPVRGVSIVTPPDVTDRVLQQVAAAGIGRVWLQPGAEGPRSLQLAEGLGLEAIGGGPCALVALGYRD
jgi:predicted CoA-binding protein